MAEGKSTSLEPLRIQKADVLQLSDEAWGCKEQRQAEGLAIRACEAFALKGTPVGNNGVIGVRIDHIGNRMLCLVRANSYLVRLRIKDGRVVAIKSVEIANQY